MYNFSGIGINDPGSDSISLGMRIGDEYFGGNPASDKNWAAAASRFMNNGIPRDPLSLNSVEYDSNQPISHTFTIYPWKDNTHNQIQTYQLVFVSKFMDSEYNLHNMAPIYRLNMEMREHYSKFNIKFGNVGANVDQFKTDLEKFGETGLDIYRSYPFNNDDLEKLSTFYRNSESENYTYLTKQGILSKWNFSGSVLSKQQSGAPNDNMDFPQTTESLNVVGVVVGGECRVYNIWGAVTAGDKLYLILSKHRNGQFYWFSWFSNKSYPNFTYKDASNRTQRAFVQYVGLCTRNMEGAPSERQIATALGETNSMEDAYETYGTLPCITVQIGI